MKKEIIKADLILNEDKSQELHIHFKAMYIRKSINLNDEELYLLNGLRSTKVGKDLLYKIFNAINS